MRNAWSGVRGSRRLVREAGHAVVTAAVVVAAVVHGGVGRPVQAQTLLAGWDFQTTATGGTALAPQDAAQPTVFAANLGTGTLYLDGSNGSSNWVSSATASRELNAFAGTAINATNGLSTTTTSPAALALVNQSANGKAMVFQFSMTGYQDLVISLAAQRTASGFTSQTWEFSTDGASYSSIGTLASGTVAGTLTTGFTTSGILTLPTVTGFNNAADAYVRVTLTGASSSTGNNRLDNIQFVASPFAPPAATLTWSGNGTDAGGPGTWTAAGANWSATGVAPFDAPWNPAGKAVFGGTGGAVAIDAGGITAAGGIVFEADGYTLSGGTLEFGGTSSQIEVAGASVATIGASIAGSNGLTKTSAGTLVLAGANAFTGPVAVAGGTLRIAADSALGAAANAVAVNGTLATTASITLGGDRDLTGSGTLDIAPGTTLTVAGDTSMSALTLANAGTLALDGVTRAVGNLTINAPLELRAAGPISASGITAPGLTGGTATIVADLVLTTGDKTVNVPGGGTLVLDGDVSGLGTSRLAKTGAGTLEINGALGGGIRVGVAGTTDGGVVVLGQTASSGTTNQLQLNYGTLATDAAGGLTLANGVSLGGRPGAVAVFGGGEDLSFTGTSSFFRGTGTSGELRVDVNNRTALSGDFAATSGAGTATGITFGGSGRLTLSGDATALTERITLQDSLVFMLENSLGGDVVVGSGAAIGGVGPIAGDLSFASSTARLVFDPAKTLAVNGDSVSFAESFGVVNLVDFSAAVADGTYSLIGGTAVVDTTNLLNLGPTNPYDLGSGRSAYFVTSASGLALQVVPEPSAIALVGLGGLVAAGVVAVRRRRRQQEG